MYKYQQRTDTGKCFCHKLVEYFTIATMSWLTLQNICQKSLWTCPVCHNHNEVLSLFIAYHRIELITSKVSAIS